MAEIPIQRKERRSWWPWLLLLLVVLVIAWYFWTRNGVSTRAPVADSTAAVIPVTPVTPGSTIAADSAAANRVTAPPARTDSAATRP